MNGADVFDLGGMIVVTVIMLWAVLRGLEQGFRLRDDVALMLLCFAFLLCFQGLWERNH